MPMERPTITFRLSDEVKEQLRRTCEELKAAVNKADSMVLMPPPRPPDPWVVVGTTTIDGKILDLAEAMTLNAHTVEDMIELLDNAMRHGDPSQRTEAARQRFIATKSSLPKPPCPECGPHGNRGRVQLNFIEVACTVCAGGVSGDAFGVVEDDSLDPIIEALAGATGGLKTSGLAEIIREEYAAVMQCTGIPRDILFGHEPTGFEVPTKATIDNYIDRLRSGQCGIE